MKVKSIAECFLIGLENQLWVFLRVAVLHRFLYFIFLKVMGIMHLKGWIAVISLFLSLDLPTQKTSLDKGISSKTKN